MNQFRLGMPVKIAYVYSFPNHELLGRLGRIVEVGRDADGNSLYRVRLARLRNGVRCAEEIYCDAENLVALQ
jgi:hypothetical protein